MSERLGFVRYAGSDTRESFVPDREYSDETAKLIDDEVKSIASEAYGDAKRLLEEHWDQVVAVAEALLIYETLSGDDVDKLMKGEKLTRPTVAEEMKAEARRRMAADVVAKLDAAQTPSTPPPGALPTPA